MKILFNPFYLDPLEQFELNHVSNINGESIFLINTSTIFLVITLTLIHFFFSTVNYSLKYNTWTWLYHQVQNLVRNLLVERIQTTRNTLIINITFLFFFILNINLIGLIPHSWTVSSWFIIIFYIGLSYFININLLLILNSGWTFLNHFLPSGTPLFISPFLFLVENISYFSRVLSLSVRLFANMLSGHALLKILISFSWGLLTKLKISFYLLSIIIWLGVSIILILECLIAGLQAYVFGLLITIYFSEILE